MIHKPESGATVAGTGGARKIRVALAGRGKRSGARVAYYFRSKKHRFYMIAAYTKSAKADLTAADKIAILKLVQTLEKEK